MASETISINGRHYDKHTGMPVSDAKAKEKDHRHATSLHSRAKRSTTLNRRYVKRAEPQPEAKKAATTPTTQTAPTPSVIQRKNVPQKKQQISKFAPHTPHRGKSIDGIGPVAHPMVQSVHASKQQKAPAKRVPKPSDIIKAEAIDTALKAAPSHNRKQHKAAPKHNKRIVSLAGAGMAVLLLGGYFTYLNMPNLSVRVAAVRAGIDASYPSYHPSGYSLSGPVAYEDGKVEIKYASNGSPQSFMLVQETSGWDSDTVLEEYVKPKAGENYAVTSESGLTIYTWNSNAAWVSGGILYTVSGDSNLSPDQIRHMAVSM
ncbi:hypothetical protein EOL96_07330 [Candidatus Saccharibacteria bacterium]|nr:hypothetical protein [Candidatus Saccharibacteria bacterium]